MSYQAYCFHVPCALVVTNEMLKVFCEKIGKDPDEDSIWDIADALEERGLSLQVQSSMEGEVVPFGKRNPNDSYYVDSDTIAYIECGLYPDFFKAVYKDFDELLAEFKESTKGWLPDDFKIEHNLWELFGVVWG